MKRMLFVFNPNSGKGQIKNALLKIIQIFSNAGFEVTTYPTKAPNDGYNHILENEGRYDVVVCSGGDGTLNETVGAVMKYNKRVPIGYIPSGTTNDFARSLKIPRDFVKAAEYIANGVPFACDIGIMNGERNFNYIAAFGAFTAVSYETPQNLKNMLGHQAYMLEAVKSLSELKPYRMKVECEELHEDDSFVYGMVSNTTSVGGVKGIVGKSVDLQDGLFEVTLIKELRNPMDLQSLVNAFITQNAEKSERLVTCRTKHISFESHDIVSWTLDGEYGGEHKKITFDVKESAVDFLVKK